MQRRCVIARAKADGNYEIVTGYRRKLACELLNLETIPTILRDLDDEESTMVMLDSNIQRENLLFSEKAFAYKMKLDDCREVIYGFTRHYFKWTRFTTAVPMFTSKTRCILLFDVLNSKRALTR